MYTEQTPIHSYSTTSYVHCTNSHPFLQYNNCFILYILPFLVNFSKRNKFFKVNIHPLVHPYYSSSIYKLHVYIVQSSILVFLFLIFEWWRTKSFGHNFVCNFFAPIFGISAKVFEGICVGFHSGLNEIIFVERILH